jgi:hypothetical protein
MNITNRTPLAGVKLFDSNTYPASCIDLYWRGAAPIIFELSDDPDEGDAYPHFLVHIHSQLSVQAIQLLQHDDHRILVAEVKGGDQTFWAVQDDDVVTLDLKKPIFSEEYTVFTAPYYLEDVFKMTIGEAVLATTFSPVDLYWLLGPAGRTVGLYDTKIWEEAARRLPGSYFLDLLATTEGTLLDPK